jgi:hypothetical protein
MRKCSRSFTSSTKSRPTIRDTQWYKDGFVAESLQGATQRFRLFKLMIQAAYSPRRRAQEYSIKSLTFY